ncbi:hypothetical protein [Streptosporangium sp. NBC_01756]|uniref:hypothetical protein n=1 Tax=Streptosporangium sp. NBC_01756 TaxID=2975950 RepID=UPI002DD8CAC8|nr:hypothetical protein [Streptosporangium sp. NBC_01756]WSC89643.1 hypothetical protein OIE48_16105 [Streptosporangium sp. NBC_01756]
MDDNAPNRPAANDKLPSRWVIILSVSTAVGIGTGLVGGLIAGVGLGFVCAGFLHTVLPGEH